MSPQRRVPVPDAEPIDSPTSPARSGAMAWRHRSGAAGLNTPLRLAANRASRLGPTRSSGSAARGTRAAAALPCLARPAGSSLREGMVPSQHGAPQRFDATPTREPRRRIGRDETGHHGGHRQAP